MADTYIYSLEGNHQRLDGGAMFGNAPRAVWEKWAPPDSVGRIDLACRALLIEHSGKRILCETGIGAFFEPKMAERFGVQNPERHMLIESLKANDIDPDSIDYLILSHLHFDHAGGILPTYKEIQNGNSQLLFSKAQYVVGREAWERALHPHFRDKASFIPGLTDKLEKSGRLVIVEEDINTLEGTLSDRLFFRRSFGHTPGQLHVGFRGDRKTVFFCGDLIPGRSWVHVPITMGYDRYPELLIDEKSELYSIADAENWLLFFTHDVDTAAAEIALNAQGKYVPTHEIRTLQHYAI